MNSQRREQVFIEVGGDRRPGSDPSAGKQGAAAAGGANGWSIWFHRAAAPGRYGRGSRSDRGLPGRSSAPTVPPASSTTRFAAGLQFHFGEGQGFQSG